jgi:hypothetical protein
LKLSRFKLDSHNLRIERERCRLLYVTGIVFVVTKALWMMNTTLCFSVATLQHIEWETQHSLRFQVEGQRDMNVIFN